MPAALRSAALGQPRDGLRFGGIGEAGKCGNAARRQSIEGRQTSCNILHTFETFDSPSQFRRALQNGAIPQAIKRARPNRVGHNQQLFEPGALFGRDLHRQTLSQPFVGAGT
jgi:hypothetical protein